MSYDSYLVRDEDLWRLRWCVSRLSSLRVSRYFFCNFASSICIFSGSVVLGIIGGSRCRVCLDHKYCVPSDSNVECWRDWLRSYSYVSSTTREKFRISVHNLNTILHHESVKTRWGSVLFLRFHLIFTEWHPNRKTPTSTHWEKKLV